MKNISVGLVVLSLLSTTAFGDVSNETATVKKSDVFVGLDIFRGSSELENDFSGAVSGTDELDYDQSGFRLKLGKRLNNDTRMQVSLEIEKFEIADDDVEESFMEDSVIGFGIDVAKELPLGNNFKAYGLAGLFVDSAEMNKELGMEYTEDRRTALGIKLGLGGLYIVNESVEIVAGFDLAYRRWQEIKFIGVGTVDLETSDTSKTFYTGLNFYF